MIILTSQNLDGDLDLRRVSCYIPNETYERLNATIHWGARGHFIARLIEVALDKVERGGTPILGAILSGDLDPLFKREEP